MNRLRKHYHWAIAFVVLIELAVFSGILNNIISLHLIPVTEDLGISRGDFSLAFSIRPLVGFFATLFSGILLVKIGYRKVVSIFLLISAVGFVILGSSQNVVMLAIASAIMGVGEGLCSTTSASRIVNTWFHSRQGMILGLVTASTGLGGSLFSVVLSKVIAASSWRYSYFLSAILVAVVGVLIYLIARNRPEDMGLLPFGVGKAHTKTSRRTSGDHWAGYDAKDVLRKPTFVLTCIVIFLSCCCTYAAFSVVVPHFQDCGISAEDAATVQSIMLLSLAAAKFICGSLSDLLGAKFINILCMVCGSIGLVLLTRVDSFTSALIASVFFSVGTVMTTITVPLLSTSLFGYKPQNTIIGIFMALIPASSVITCPIVNMLYDRIGSYNPIFLGTAGIGATVVVLMIPLFILASRDRKQLESMNASIFETEETK